MITGKLERGWPYEAEPPDADLLAERDWPRVALVTPSYQQAGYLEETILSVLNQGYPHLDYYVIDGGSTDGSLAILQRYSDRLTHWESVADRGQSHAVNKGWKRASATYLWWLNSDDLLTPGSIFKSVRYLEEHPESGLVFGNLHIIDEAGRILERRHFRAFDYPHMLRVGKDVPQAGALMRQTCLDRVGYLNEDLHLVMDLDYWHRLALAGIHIAYLPEPLALFRIYDETKTQSSPVNLIAERCQVAGSICSHPSFQENYKHLEQDVWSNTYAACARGYAKAGAFGEGLRACWRSLLHRPARLFDGRWWYLIALNGVGIFLGREQWLQWRARTRTRRAGPASETNRENSQ